MTRNEGSLDRALRVLLGLGLLSMLVLVEGPQRLWGLVGLVPLATGLLGFCPLYALIGLNTCPAGKAGR
jgi:hypothetical protein